MSGPLTGIRVIELAGIGPGPMCAMLLADLGADVIRVDRPAQTDLGVPRMARQFDVLLRGRRSIAVDLKSQEGVETVLRMVGEADVLIEGFRPGVTERLGLGPEECEARNPRLVYGRMTGWGQDGPLATAAGHDINYIALTGALAAIGNNDGPPVPPLNLVGDYGGGALYLAFGVCAALLEARSSGHGQIIDAVMVDGAASLLSSVFGLCASGAWQLERGSNVLDSGSYFYGTYQCSDGEWISIAPIEGKGCCSRHLRRASVEHRGWFTGRCRSRANIPVRFRPTGAGTTGRSSTWSRSVRSVKPRSKTSNRSPACGIAQPGRHE